MYKLPNDLGAILDWTKSTEALRIHESLRQSFGSIAEQAKTVKLLETIRIDPRIISSKFDGLSKELFQPNELRQALHRQLDELNGELGRAREMVYLREIASGLPEITEAYRKMFSFDLKSHAEKVLKSISNPLVDWSEYEEREARTLSLAAANGWFSQPETDAGLGKYIEECGDDSELLDNLFIHFIERDFDSIEKRIGEAFPSIEHIFKEAFLLHRECRYIASVPLYFIAADGISKLVTGKNAFNGNGKGATQIADWVGNKDIDSWAEVFFNIISSHHALSQPNPGLLNRHKVLHGQDLAYHTKVNSLKALSFLGFIGWLLSPNGDFIKQLSQDEVKEEAVTDAVEAQVE